MTIELNDKQREMVRHAIGFDGRSKTTTRNHYCIGVGGDGYEDWAVLLRDGLVTRRAPSELSGGDDTFYVGRELALFVRKNNEHLSRDFRP